MLLILIRRGQSVGNFERRLQGQENFPLTDRGREQAQCVAQRLASLGLAAIYTSPLKRALETAQIVAACLGVGALPTPAVQEDDFGEPAGLSYQEVGQW